MLKSLFLFLISDLRRMTMPSSERHRPWRSNCTYSLYTANLFSSLKHSTHISVSCKLRVCLLSASVNMKHNWSSPHSQTRKDLCAASGGTIGTTPRNAIGRSKLMAFETPTSLRAMWRISYVCHFGRVRVCSACFRSRCLITAATLLRGTLPDGRLLCSQLWRRQCH